MTPHHGAHDTFEEAGNLMLALAIPVPAVSRLWRDFSCTFSSFKIEASCQRELSY